MRSAAATAELSPREVVKIEHERLDVLLPAREEPDPLHGFLNAAIATGFSAPSLRTEPRSDRITRDDATAYSPDAEGDAASNRGDTDPQVDVRRNSEVRLAGAK